MRLRYAVLIPLAAAVAVGLSVHAARPEPTPQTSPPPAGLKRATFAGGCFWCMEGPFEKLPGVVSVVSGYTGGRVANPTYQQVGSGGTGHTEAVEITYDPAKVTYTQLLDVFWRNIDPTVRDRQFCDVGEQYRTGIFVHDDEQRVEAEASKKKVAATKTFREPIVTPIETAGPFYRAEEYHQDFYKKNPGRYHSYRSGCGRDARLRELWGSAPH
ncbi:MAG TPA: peptide-methionine (S)-S-oxide reductase MsrA [Vicinamibacteria bacterium]|nr:peptide-methionine (S)-S-oxide reductase MsrA [Vicinamibacteria bacterium]